MARVRRAARGPSAAAHGRAPRACPAAGCRLAILGAALLATTIAAGAQTPPESIEDLLLTGRFGAAHRGASAASPLACGPGGPSPRACAVWIRLAALDWSGPRTRDLPAPTAESLRPDTVELFERGWLAARAAWPGGDAELLTIAHAAADALAARGGLEAERYQGLVLAAIGAAQEERDVMTLALTQAADLEMRLRMASIELPPFFAFDRVAGDLWLQVHRFEQARLHYRAATARDARDARAWLGLARAATRLGDREEAIRAAGTFLTMWTGADTDRPELEAARAILAAALPAP